MYRITRDNRIEARTAAEAEERLMENNGVAEYYYFTDEAEAERKFAELKENLWTPSHNLGRGLRWFDGIIMEYSEEDIVSIYVKDFDEEEEV